MSFRVGPGEGDSSLVMEGELDLASVERLLTAIDLCAHPNDHGELILDCRRLTFLDGTGVQALSNVADKFTGGSRLVLVGTTGIVLRVLRLLRVDQHPRIELRP
jgi:anti-anti-sigma factor